MKRSAALAGRALRRRECGIRVLVYHRIGGGSGLEMDLETETFAAQLDELAARLPVIPLADALTRTARGELVDASVITFDDGFADTYRNAVPLLRKRGFAAHFYVATALVESGLIETTRGAVAAMTPRDVAELSRDPLFSVGSHAHTHRVLTRLSDADIDAELLGSRSLVREWTGREAEDFCYPKAIWDARVERAVRSRYRSAAIGGSRALAPGADMFRIRRFPVKANDGVAFFAAKLQGDLFLEDAARDARDAIRRAVGRVPER